MFSILEHQRPMSVVEIGLINLPTEKYKRNVVRGKLDLVGKLVWLKNVFILLENNLFKFIQKYHLVDQHLFSLVAVYWVSSKLFITSLYDRTDYLRKTLTIPKINQNQLEEKHNKLNCQQHTPFYMLHLYLFIIMFVNAFYIHAKLEMDFNK